MDMVIAEDRGAEEVEGPEEPDNLSLLVRYFEEAEQSSAEARKLAERDRDYVDGKQFTDQELAALAKRGQPPLVTNLIQPKVNYLLGYEASQRQDPRAFPRTQQDESAAEAATDALRFVAQSTSLDQKFSNCWDELLVEGSESIEVGVDLTNPDDPRITVTILHWDRMFADPHAREPDYSDARFLGGVIWMDESEALAKWPDAGDAIASTISDTDQFAEDRPSHKRWVTGGDRKRVRIAQI